MEQTNLTIFNQIKTALLWQSEQWVCKIKYRGRYIEYIYCALYVDNAYCGWHLPKEMPAEIFRLMERGEL